MSTAVALPGHEVIGIVPPGELVELGIVQAVPIIKVPWSDTRQTCKLVHEYLAGTIEGRFEEYHSCSGYAAGVCPRHWRRRTAVPLPRGRQVAGLGPRKSVATGAPARTERRCCNSAINEEARIGVKPTRARAGIAA